MRFIKTRLLDFLKEDHTTNTDLILFHGSNNRKIYDRFYDNQFFTVNDYIASNYAYNFGGLMYKVKVSNLNPFELKSYDKRREPEKHDEMVELLRTLYNDHAAEYYEKRYFTPSPAYIFAEQGWDPIIDWCKKNGYDSLKFNDESFDTYVKDITYLIFDGSKPEITKVYNVDYNDESGQIEYTVKNH
jgi:hypothetical protein